MKYVIICCCVLLSFFGMDQGNAQPYQGRAHHQQMKGQAQQKPPAQNIMIILDASESMNGRMGGQSKLQIAKNVILQTIRTLPPHVNVGLRVYGHRYQGGGVRFSGPFGSYSRTDRVNCAQTELLVPMRTNNRAQIASQLVGVDAVGKTPITYTLQESINYDFQGHPGSKTIILVSDGRETCASNPCDLAIGMVRAGVDVKINTIGFGLTDMVAKDQLKCIALSTKGKFYDAHTAAELAKSLQASSYAQTSVQAKIHTTP